jgi:hypothetical protein
MRRSGGSRRIREVMHQQYGVGIAVFLYYSITASAVYHCIIALLQHASAVYHCIFVLLQHASAVRSVYCYITLLLQQQYITVLLYYLSLHQQYLSLYYGVLIAVLLYHCINNIYPSLYFCIAVSLYRCISSISHCITVSLQTPTLPHSTLPHCHTRYLRTFFRVRTTVLRTEVLTPENATTLVHIRIVHLLVLHKCRRTTPYLTYVLVTQPGQHSGDTKYVDTDVPRVHTCLSRNVAAC